MRKNMKKHLLTLFILLSLNCVVFAAEKNGKIQDTEAAFKYFQDELNFTAGPGVVRQLF